VYFIRVLALTLILTVKSAPRFMPMIMTLKHTGIVRFVRGGTKQATAGLNLMCVFYLHRKKLKITTNSRRRHDTDINADMSSLHLFTATKQQYMLLMQ